jgi:hypothetical protein
MIEKTHETDPEAERKLLGIPYDWRLPTWSRVKSRTWNSTDRRIFTPKPFGHGHVINGYWLVHPIRYWRRRNYQ